MQNMAIKENYAAGEGNVDLDELFQLILMLLSSPKLSDDLEIAPELMESPQFERLYKYILDLRDLTYALCQGDLQKFVYSKGYILSNLKALQSNLRHLTWQTKKVAEGDFSQRVDFLGEFSDAFNEMTIKLRDSSLQLHRLASIDNLTQIPNRMALEQFLAHAFQDSRQKDKPFSIMMIDIDHFKNVNDTYGHTVGDKVLIRISEILNRQFRSSDIFARYGGEEFIACLTGTNLEVAKQVANRALEAVANANLKIDDQLVLRATVSIGVSELKESDQSYDDLIKRSDDALYEAKRSGRDQVCVLM